MLLWIGLSILALFGIIVLCCIGGMSSDDFGGALAIGMGALLIGWLLIIMGIRVNVNSQCIAVGWREGGFDLIRNQRYCITRSDQTDIVRPLADALRNPR